jgi:aminoglycoside phosphotransferase (APT) family kinase protein
MTIEPDLPVRLQEVTPAAMQAALDAHGLGNLTAMRAPVGGSFGQVLLVSTTAGEWVFKGAPLVPEQFAAERFFTDLLHERTDVPVPWPYLHDRSRDVFPWDFALMPRMPGTDLGDTSEWTAMSLDDQRSIASDMGRRLVDVGAVTHGAFGTYDGASDAIVPTRDSYGAMVATECRGVLDRSLGEMPQHWPAADREWVESVISGVEAAFAPITTPRLTMQDFKDQNMVAQRTGTEWRISGLFDLGGLHFGDPAMGLSRQIAQFSLRPHTDTLVRAFIGSALDAGLDATNLPDRLRSFMLLERLAIWEWALREGREGIVGDGRSFQAWASPVIDAGLNALH